MIRVFIYDDNIVWRNSLKSLMDMNSEITVVGEAGDCCHVEDDMAKSSPEVVLMDINMPECNGIDGLKLIRSKYPQIKVLMQTAFDDSNLIFSSIKNGASGYVLKNDKPLRILQAIEEVYQGGAAMNPAIAMKVLEYFKPSEKQEILSAKEMETLGYLAQGLSYKMVADKMGISYTTVNSHAKNIYNKLHISSLGEAIAWYYKNVK